MTFQKTSSEPHPYADVIEMLTKAEAMDPSKGQTKIYGTSGREYTISDLLREVRNQTPLGLEFAEKTRELRNDNS